MRGMTITTTFRSDSLEIVSDTKTNTLVLTKAQALSLADAIQAKWLDEDDGSVAAEQRRP